MKFNPLEHPVCLEFPLWLEETAWALHIPFAMFLVSSIRPQILVELGAWRGVSYCAFCQAVKGTRQTTRCYAVDGWRGDEHAGNLGDEALFALREHHDPKYSDFSSLIQSSFDEALKHFSDNSIDLLHIDGFHSYEAVRHDFETWLPKMSKRGIVLFHDINVRERGFGVYQFWEEVSAKYANFDFLHGYGLGVLAVGAEIADELRFLFDEDEREKVLIREFFYALGSRVEAMRQVRDKDRVILDHQKLIAALRTYEDTVNKSRVLRGFRILKDEGAVSLFRKATGKAKSK
jgi:hypothetical protein